LKGEIEISKKGKPTLLIIGGSGYVGRHLCCLARRAFNVCYTYLTNPIHIDGCQGFRLDIADEGKVVKLVDLVSPGIIYHTAYDRTNLWNSIVDGTTNLMNGFKMLKNKFRKEKNHPLLKFFFLSTDAVFDGEKKNYTEQDAPQPIWDYGKAKRRAEEIVLSNGGTVIRTSLVYGFDPLDSRTRDLFLGLRGEKLLISYFDDEYRCPIYVSDLCEALLELGKVNAPSVIHVAGPQRLSRYEFAVGLAEATGFDKGKVKKGYQEESGLIRPKDVSMSISLAQNVLKTKLRSPEEVFSERIFS